MSIKPAAMSSCKRKKRCFFGPNEGVAYTPGDECPPGSEFNEATCDCDPSQNCVEIWAKVTLVDGRIESNDGICSSEYCSDPRIIWSSAPFTGVDPQDISVANFYTPNGCGFDTRGALINYRFPSFCDESLSETSPDDMARTFTAVLSNGVDVQAARCDVYTVPAPRPIGCSDPFNGRVSEGAGAVPDCFTLVASAVNNAPEVNCPSS